MVTILRPSRAAIRFSGPEAQKLLFDVVTGRLLSEPGPAVWWALLSPQGKIQAEGLSGWHDDAFWLDVDTSVADAFIRRMKMYRLRAKMDIDDLRETHAVGWSEDGTGTGVIDADPRAGGLGYRVIADKPDAAAWRADSTAHTAARIAAGIAELGPDFSADTAFAHDIALDALDGIDFVKGCYIGQEVVSRMKHRGTARRRPVIVSGIEAAPNSPVTLGEREAGTIGAVVDGKAVAILRLDRIIDPAAATVGGKPVSLALPAWATYAFGESVPAD